jgi:hypothetical protein
VCRALRPRGPIASPPVLLDQGRFNCLAAYWPNIRACIVKDSVICMPSSSLSHFRVSCHPLCNAYIQRLCSEFRLSADPRFAAANAESWSGACVQGSNSCWGLLILKSNCRAFATRGCERAGADIVTASRMFPSNKAYVTNCTSINSSTVGLLKLRFRAHFAARVWRLGLMTQNVLGGWHGPSPTFLACFRFELRPLIGSQLNQILASHLQHARQAAEVHDAEHCGRVSTEPWGHWIKLSTGLFRALHIFQLQ